MKELTVNENRDKESHTLIQKEVPAQFHFETLSNIILPQKHEVYSWPLLIFYYSLYMGILITLFVLYGVGINWPGAVYSLVTSNILPLAILMYGYEPLKMIAAMLITPKYPELPAIEEVNATKYQEILFQNKDLAIIIPCHKSALVILDTIRSCLKHVKENQIFVMDNDKNDVPTDTTAELLKINFPDVNYFFLPNTGNKTLALFYGAHYAKEKFNYCVLIDDDVHLPEHFKFNRHFFDEDVDVKGLVFPIRAMSEYTPGTALTTLITSWQDLEYQLSDLDMLFLDIFDGVIRPHGAGSLWNIDALIQVLLKHNTVFHGEDVLMGLILQHMHGHGQYILRLDKENYISTFVPVTYFGPQEQGNLWFQRVRSWNVAQFTNFWQLALKPFLTIWDRHDRGFFSLIVTKENELYNLYTQITHVLRFPLMIISAGIPLYWWTLVASIGVQTTTSLAFNYLKLPPHLRNNLLTTVTFPLYSCFNSFMGSVSFLRALFIEIPTGGRSQSNIENMLHNHDLSLSDLNSNLESIENPKETIKLKNESQLSDKTELISSNYRIGKGFFASITNNEIPLEHEIKINFS